MALVTAAVLVFAPVRNPSAGPVNVHGRAVASRNAALKRGPRLINSARVESADRFWQEALEEVDRSPEEIRAQDTREVRSGIYLPKLIRGDADDRLLALTFDDGPHPGKTEKLLSLLAKENVKATFFVVGKMVERYPELLKRIDAAGHTIGNHTFSHVTLTKIPDNEVRAEYEACNDVVEHVIHKRMRLCRPPGGDYDREVIKAATEQGLTTVLWTDDPGDYASPGTHTIESKTLERLSNGGIILLHDGVGQTLQVLPQIIDYARRRGYRFVTLDELESSLAAPGRMASFAKPQRIGTRGVRRVLRQQAAASSKAA